VINGNGVEGGVDSAWVLGNRFDPDGWLIKGIDNRDLSCASGAGNLLSDRP